jgi:hypothetical protein
MPVRLTNNDRSKSVGTKLDKNQLKFKIALTGNLFNNYEFKDLKPEAVKVFHKFIDETVGKGLTITNAESKLLRTKGKPSFEELVNGKKRDIIHFGQGKTAFRIFGYYNDDGYFVICRIDPNHKFHKS